MNKTLLLSAAASAKIYAFLQENPGVHMPMIVGIERAIADRLEPIVAQAGRDALTGARISYTSSAPTSAAYRYKIRGLSADLLIKARSIDLIDIRVESLYPKTKTRVDVVMSDERARRIANAISEAAAAAARRSYSSLRIASRRDPFVAVRSAA